MSDVTKDKWAVGADVEAMARGIVSGGGGDPDQDVQPGVVQRYGTPSGECFAVVPGANVPLWRQYIPAAQKMLALARGIDAHPKPHVVDVSDELEKALAKMKHDGAAA